MTTRGAVFLISSQFTPIGCAPDKAVNFSSLFTYAGLNAVRFVICSVNNDAAFSMIGWNRFS